MANRIKMVQKELLFTLFSRNWSGRKINSLAGLHRATIRRYKKEWRHRQPDKESDPTPVKSLFYSGESCPDLCQSVPPGEKEVPTEGVVHFQVPIYMDTFSNLVYLQDVSGRIENKAV